MSSAAKIAGLELLRDLSDALGLPRNTRRAKIILEAGCLPRIEIEAFAIVEPGEWNPVDLERVRRLRYVVRLEPSRFDQGSGDAL